MKPIQYQSSKLLSELSTFGIGGPARVFIEVSEIEELCAVLTSAREQNLPYIVIGKGSNCLFDDKGFDGLVILNKIAFMKQEGNEFYVGAGYSFSLLGVQTARKGYSGLEFACGIPATVGGAIYMNAGANGAETADVLSEVEYISAEGERLLLKRSVLDFSYRTSSFQKKKGAIVAGRFRLQEACAARQKQLDIITYRTKTQPYGEKSIGCVFRNPQNLTAGALIEQSGLKGRQVGGAEVSLIHANFIVNKNQATAKDVLELVELVRATVKEKTGVELEMEIRAIPYYV
ncbi:MAG: UDP-N-acetylmuramate dehydrogenase [Chlamydiota bacterium]